MKRLTYGLVMLLAACSTETTPIGTSTRVPPKAYFADGGRKSNASVPGSGLLYLGGAAGRGELDAGLDVRPTGSPLIDAGTRNNDADADTPPSDAAPTLPDAAPAASDAATPPAPTTGKTCSSCDAAHQTGCATGYLCVDRSNSTEGARCFMRAPDPNSYNPADLFGCNGLNANLGGATSQEIPYCGAKGLCPAWLAANPSSPL